MVGDFMDFRSEASAGVIKAEDIQIVSDLIDRFKPKGLAELCKIACRRKDLPDHAEAFAQLEKHFSTVVIELGPKENPNAS